MGAGAGAGATTTASTYLNAGFGYHNHNRLFRRLRGRLHRGNGAITAWERRWLASRSLSASTRLTRLRQGVPSEATQLLTMPALAAADTVIAERTSASLLNFDMHDSLGVRTILALGLLNTYMRCFVPYCRQFLPSLHRNFDFILLYKYF